MPSNCCKPKQKQKQKLKPKPSQAKQPASLTANINYRHLKWGKRRGVEYAIFITVYALHTKLT